MSRPEFVRWVDFYEQFPFDDRARYQLPAAMIASTSPGPDRQSPEFKKVMEFFDATGDGVPEEYKGYSAADVTILRELGGMPPKRSKG